MEKQFHSFATLTDRELLARVKSLAIKECEATADLIASLAELDVLLTKQNRRSRSCSRRGTLSPRWLLSFGSCPRHRQQYRRRLHNETAIS